MNNTPLKSFIKILFSTDEKEFEPFKNQELRCFLLDEITDDERTVEALKSLSAYISERSERERQSKFQSFKRTFAISESHNPDKILSRYYFYDREETNQIQSELREAINRLQESIERRRLLEQKKTETLGAEKFIHDKVKLLNKNQLRVFLNTKQGNKLPEFVVNWRKEFYATRPKPIKGKSFSNALTRVRKNVKNGLKQNPDKKSNRSKPR